MLSKKRLAGFFLVFLLSFTMATQAFATSKTLTVTKYDQAKSNWCWAAAGTMVGRYQNSNSTRNQWDVVENVKGPSYPNESGTDAELRSGLHFAAMHIVNYRYASTLSFASHKAHIDALNPIVAKIQWAHVASNHAYVCIGYETVGSVNYLKLIDPLPNISNERIIYTALINSATLKSGVGTYITSFYRD